MGRLCIHIADHLVENKDDLLLQLRPTPQYSNLGVMPAVPKQHRRNFLQSLCVLGSVAVLGGQAPACNEVPAGPSIPGASEELSVMSFNIRYDNPEDGEDRWELRRPACASLLDEASPDIVGFQEVLYHQLEQLQADMPEYAWVGVGRDDGRQAGEYAPIFYKEAEYEELSWGTFWLSETPNKVSLGWDAAAVRIVTWARLRSLRSDKELFVFNTHFDHKGKKAREMSAKLVHRKVLEIAGEDAITFLTGDLNARLSTPAFKSLRELFYDARNAPQSDDTRTFNAFGRFVGWFVGRIDFVLYRNAEVKRFDTMNQDFGVPYVSDHYPVVAQFVY